MTRTPFGALIALALALAFAATWPFRGDLAQSVAVTTMVRPLAHAKSWRFVPGASAEASAIASLASDRSDLLVIGDSMGPRGTALTVDEVAALKARSGARPRLVLAHIDITEVSARDVYWDASWSIARPGWFNAPICAAREAYPVKFWNDDWKKIIFSDPGSYLYRVAELGFDGVYLDGLDRLKDFDVTHPSAKSDLTRFITELAAKARSRNPGFIVMVQEELELLDNADLRSVIDGTGLEGLLYGSDGRERRPASHIAQTFEALRPLQRDGKPIFAVEYATDDTFVDRAGLELRRRGIVPGFEQPEPRATHAHDCGTAAAHN